MRHILTISLLLFPCALSAKPNALPPPVVPQCFGVNANLSVDPGTTLDRFQSAGVGWVSTKFRWADIERTKGAYDFTDADTLLAALTARRIAPVFVLDAANASYPPGPAQAGPFTRFVTAAVQRYRGRQILWEVGPSVPAATAKTIKVADPEATVVVYASFVASSASEVRALLADADAVVLSPSSQGGPVNGSDSETLRRLIQTEAPPGKDIPLISSASGLAPPLLTRHLLSDLAAGVRLSLYDDVTGDSSVPAAMALRTLTRTLSGYRFIKRIPLASPDDYLLLFARGPDGVKLAAWTAGPDHAILLPLAAVAAVTGMTGENLPVTPAAGRLSLPLTGSPVYLAVHGDTALKQAGAWTAAAPEVFYTQGQPLHLALTYHNPDGVPHRVRFVALLTTPDGTRTPVPAGEDNVGPHESLALGMRAPALAGAKAEMRVGLVLDGSRQSYPQDVEFAPLTPLTLTVAPLTATDVQVQVDNPSGLAFVGSLNATGSGGLTSVPVSLTAGQTTVAVSVPLRPSDPVAWRLRDRQGRLAASRTQERLIPYPVSLPDVRPLPADGSDAAPGGQLTQSAVGVAQRVRYQFASGHSSWQIGEDQPLVLPGRPTGYGLWVYGDAGGAPLSMEFGDSTGQTYTVGGGQIAWTGWRFVTFPLRAGDAPVEYPVKITALLRLQPGPGPRGLAGALLWKGPAIIYETATVPHRV